MRGQVALKTGARPSAAAGRVNNGVLRWHLAVGEDDVARPRRAREAAHMQYNSKKHGADDYTHVLERDTFQTVFRRLQSDTCVYEL